MWIVHLDFAAIQADQDTVVAQVGLSIQSVVEDHPRVGLEQLSEQLGGLFRLERDGGKALLAGIECESMGPGGQDMRADLLCHALPNGELFAVRSEGPIDHGQGCRTTGSTSVDRLLRHERNRHHVVQLVSDRIV